MFQENLLLRTVTLLSPTTHTIDGISSMGMAPARTHDTLLLLSSSVPEQIANKQGIVTV
jgi:hypothetical protein